MDKLVVKEWLMKCKEKALNSVIKETEDLLVSYADVYPEIADGYNKKLQIKDLIQQIKEEYPKLKVNHLITVQCHAPAYRDVKFGDLPAFALAYLRQNEMNEEIEKVGLLIKKRKEVEKEYNSLIHNVMQIEDVNDCVSYLTNLGFDTSSLLVMPDNVNKNLLFVCHNNKP